MIVIASARAFMLGHEGAHDIRPLVAAEIAGALMLGWRTTQLVGAGLLILIFAGAQIISVVQGSWQIHFLQYACSAICIVMLDRALAAQG